MSNLMTDKKIERIERQAMIAGIDRVAVYLQQTLGQKLTAYLAGLKDPKVVGLWAQGKKTPRDLSAHRLRCAYKAALLLTEAFGSETAKSWFFGTNTRLDDEAPAYVLRHMKVPEDMRLIVPAARSFVSSAA